jgi:hypothetical protein
VSIENMRPMLAGHASAEQLKALFNMSREYPIDDRASGSTSITSLNRRATRLQYSSCFRCLIVEIKYAAESRSRLVVGMP